jgi:hypothetical protein
MPSGERYNAKGADDPMKIHTSIENLLGVTAETKPRVYLRLFAAAELNLNYILELLLSAGIATFGLVLNSPAVVIGAMLVSPLMGPILAAGLALAASDVYLGIKCLINLILSVLLAVIFSAAIPSGMDRLRSNHSPVFSDEAEAPFSARTNASSAAAKWNPATRARTAPKAMVRGASVVMPVPLNQSIHDPLQPENVESIAFERPRRKGDENSARWAWS